MYPMIGGVTCTEALYCMFGSYHIGPSNLCISIDVLDILLFIYPVQSCSVVVSSENLTAPQTCDLFDASCVQSLDYDKGAWVATSYALDARPKSCRNLIPSKSTCWSTCSFATLPVQGVAWHFTLAPAN